MKHVTDYPGKTKFYYPYFVVVYFSCSGLSILILFDCSHNFKKYLMSYVW